MEFKEVKLKDVVTILGDGIHGTPKYNKNGKYYFINGNNLCDGKIIIKADTKTVDLEEYKKYKRDLNDRTLLVSINGTLGNIAVYNNEKCILGKSACYFNIREDVNKEFIKYVLYSCDFQKYIQEYATGTTIKNMSLKAMREYQFKFPNITLQNKISNILSTIDKKIELNSQINDNLYELSQELFKRWFVDFEFPNSDGLEYKSANGTFKEVNGEQIPVDWQIMRLDEVAECQNGNAFYKDGYDESGIMVVDLGNVNINGSFIYTNADKYISQERLQVNHKYGKYELHKNDLVMVMTDRKATMDLLGKTGKIYENKQYLLNQRMYRIRSKINVNYLYTVLNSSKILDELKSKALGSVQKYVNTGHINELKILVGTDEIMEKFSQIVNPIFERIENNILENDSLQKLRDTLLPKLMNGEIDLENVEI